MPLPRVAHCLGRVFYLPLPGNPNCFATGVWRECVETAGFLDLSDVQRRLSLRSDNSNLQHPHQGCGWCRPIDSSALPWRC
jgi:hypothetical protein